MFIRIDRKRLKDGTERSYVCLAHNVWEEGPVGKPKRAKPIIFAKLGAEEDLDIDMVRSARDAFDRYLQRRLEREGRRAEVVQSAAAEKQPVAGALKVLASREFGLRVIVEAVWKQLGLDVRLSRLARRHEITFDFERVVFAMVLNRLVDPQSKRACNDWLKDFVWFPEGEGWDVQHFYRALDLLEEHEDEILGALQDAVAERLPAEDLKLLLLDTTSSYFETDLDDVERAALAEEGDDDTDDARSGAVNDPPLRMRGFSKDKRPDRPQVVIGMVGTTGGRLLAAKVYPGNRNDQTITTDLLAQVHTRPGSRVVVAMDAGMGGGPNLAAIDALPGCPDRVSGVPMRSVQFAEDVLSRPGRWRNHPRKPDFTFRVVDVPADASPSGRAERWIATRNTAQKEQGDRKLRRHLDRVEAVLAKNDSYEDHNLAVCKLLSDPTLKKYVRLSKDGRRVVIDRDRVAREERLAGVKVIRSTLVDLDPVVSLDAYQALLGVEYGFRTLKTPLRLRPMHHRAARRIRAHVLMCGLALACLQELEHRTGRTFADLQRVFGQVQAVRLEQGKTRFWQRGEWSEEALGLLEKLDVPAGPLTWGAERVEA